MLEKTKIPLRKLISIVTFFIVTLAVATAIPFIKAATNVPEKFGEDALEEITPTYDLSRTVPYEWLKFDKKVENGEKIATFVGFDLEAQDTNNLRIGEWRILGSNNYNYFVGMSSGKSLQISGSTGIDAYPTLEIPAYTTDGYKVTKINKVGKGTQASDDYSPYVQFITAVVVPGTVSYIEENAFAFFFSLEYLKVPFLGIDTAHPRPLADMVSLSSQDGGENRGITYAPEISSLIPKKEDGSNDYGITLSDESLPQLLSRKYEYYTGTSYATASSKKTYYIPKRINCVEITQGTNTSEEFYLDYKFSDRAFFNYPYLNKVTITNDIQNLDSYNLFAESGLTEVKLPEIASIMGIGIFNYCSKLETVTLPDMLHRIPDAAFYGCTSLEKVYVPATVEEFGESCFENCSRLKDIAVFNAYNSSGEVVLAEGKKTGFNIPTATKSIGASAFANCSQFNVINLASGYDAASPNQVATSNLTTIGEGAIRGCTSLTTLIVPFVGKQVGNRNSREAVMGFLFGATQLEGTTLASQQYGANSNTDAIKTYIPDSLTTIVVTGETYLNRGAFQGMQNLQTLTISASLQGMSQQALADCSNFKKLVVPFVGYDRDSQFNPSYLFKYDEAALPTGSPYYKAQNCNVPKTFISIEITDSPVIKYGLFHNLSYIQEVIIGSAVTETFENGIFFNNNALKRLVVPFVGWHNYIWAPNYPHSGWNWWSVDRNVRNSLAWLFATSSSSSSEYVNENFCDGGTSSWNARKHYIPNALKEVEITNASIVGTWALRGFKSLEKVTVSNTPSCIQYQAFGGCTSLQEIEVPYLGYNGNSHGSNNAEYTLGYYFGTVTGSSYVAMHNYRIPYTLTTVRVRDNTSKIADYAFYNCSSLSSIELTGSISEIGYASFYGCSNLGHLTTLNANYTDVPDYAFFNCQTLDSLYTSATDFFIPNSVVNIGAYAFANTSVKNVDFTKYKKIGAYAFANCLQLTNVNVTSNVKSIGEGVFSGCSNIQTAALSQGLVSKNLFRNCTSLRSINLENITNDIPDGFFYNCISLKSYDSETGEGLRMPVGNKTIGAQAFFNCKSLTSFTLGNSTTSIGKAAFQNCSGLSMMRIPNSVVSIAEAGWYGCNDNFYFTVLQHEEDWPEGWIDGWPCDFPVIIEGDVDDSVFQYVYDPVSKGYLIVGVTEGFELGGTVQLPTNHNGISVKGVIGPAFANQTKVLSFVVPQTYEVLKKSYTVDGNTYEGGAPFSVGKYVVVYMMDTLEQAIAKGWHSLSDTDIEEVNSPNRKENLLSDNAVFYYKDYWELVKGNKSSSSVPTLRVDQLVFNTDDDLFFYDGVTNHERIILSITTRGIPAGNATQVVLYSKEAETPSDYADEIYSSSKNLFEKNTTLTIFDSKYSNNLLAGENKATLELTPNDAKIKKYNQEYTYKKTLDLDFAPIYLTGKYTIRYSIEKKNITVFYTDDASPYSLQNHAYDGQPYSVTFTKDNTLNDTTYVYGLGTRFYLTGTLATYSISEGKYTGDVKYVTERNDQNQYVDVVGSYMCLTDEDSSEVRWKTKWQIYDINGRNVTANFDLIINTCFFKITPRKVKVIWEETNYTNEIAGVRYPLYPYQGSVIYPSAKAVDYDDASKTWGTSNDLIKVTYLGKAESSIEIKPSYVDGVQKRSPNRVFAVLNTDDDAAYKKSRNFEIVDIIDGRVQTATLSEEMTGIPATNGVYLDYHIAKAHVSVDIKNTHYTMDANETYWSISDFTNNNKGTVKITGLGAGSIIEGTYKTKEEGDEFVQKLYTSAAQMFEWKDGITHIYRMKNGERIDEDDCYELPITISASIDVYYNQFDIKFYIDYDANATNTPLTMGTKSVNNQTVLTYTYVTVGGEHTLTGQAINSNLNVEGTYYNTLKRTYAYNINDVMATGLHDPMTFDEAAAGDGKLYEMIVTYERHNFETMTLHVYFYNKKSQVLLSSFDKEYDSKSVEPYSKVTKIAKNYPYEQNVDGTGKAIDQYNSLRFDFYYKSNFSVDLIGTLTPIGYVNIEGSHGNIPTAVNEKNVANQGGYVVVVNCIETDYFEGLTNKVIDFEITRRIIYIDLAEQGASKNWDGEKYSFTPESSKYQSNRGLDTNNQPYGDLLSGHTLTGTLETVSSEPKVYSLASDWKWNPQWGVHNTYNEDVSSCYKIQFKNSFEIKARTLNVTVHNIDREFGKDDLEVFTFRVTAVDSATGGAVDGGYTVYYSLYDATTSDDYPRYWKTTPYSYSRPDYYTIYYKVVAPHYKTVYGVGHINVWLGNITYTMGVYNYDGHWEIEYGVQNSNIDYDKPHTHINIDYNSEYHQVGVDEKHPWYAYARYYWRKLGETSWHYSENAPAFKELGTYELEVTVRAKNTSYYNWNREREYYIVNVRLEGYGEGGEWPIIITNEYQSSVIAANNSSMASHWTVSTPHNVYADQDGKIWYAIKLGITDRFAVELRDNRCYTTQNGRVVPNVTYEYSLTGTENSWTTNYLSFNEPGKHKVYYRIRTYDWNDNPYKLFGYAEYNAIGNPENPDDLLYVTLRIKEPSTISQPSDDDCFKIEVIDNDNNLIQDVDNIIYDEDKTYYVRVSIKDGDTEELEAARNNHSIYYKANINDDWQTQLIPLKDAGTYIIYYKVIAEGFASVGLDNENFVYLTIKKRDIPWKEGGNPPIGPEGDPEDPGDPNDPDIAINVFSYNGTYDSLPHGVNVVIHEDVVRRNLDIDDSVVLTFNVYYSLDITSKTSDTGWSETPITRTNVGETSVYVKIEIGNYKPLYFSRHIRITQAEMSISVPTKLEVEYSGKKTKAINNDDIFIIESPILYCTSYDKENDVKQYVVINRDNYNTLGLTDVNGNPYESYDAFYIAVKAEDKAVTEKAKKLGVEVRDLDVDEFIKIYSIYDGQIQYKFYSTKIVDGERVKNKPVTPILPGIYYVEITYPSTTNVIGASIESELTIVPKTLHLTWNDRIAYDGIAHRPVVAITEEDLDAIDDEIHVRVYNLDENNEPVEGVEHTDLGDYDYFVEIFEDGMDIYYRLEASEITMSIVKRKIAIVVDIRVPYQQNHPWSSDDEQDGINLNDCVTIDSTHNYVPKVSSSANAAEFTNASNELVTLLQGHRIVGNIYTDSYARGTYLLYYGIDPETGTKLYFGDEATSERANIYNLFVKWNKLDNFDILDSNDTSVTNYYVVKFDFRVKIVYPDMNIRLEPATVVYDGLPHTLDIDLENLPVATVDRYDDDGNPILTTDRYKDAYVEYSMDGETWASAATFEGYVDACADPTDPYDIYVKLSHPSYEEYFIKTSLTILKTTLDVEIENDEVVYDAEVHNVKYTIANATITQEPTAILYYLVSEYDGSKVFDDILLKGKNSQYYSLGIQNPTEAGDYYAIVYFEAARNWYASGEIGYLTISKRPLRVTIPDEIYAFKSYDGEKYAVSLRGATIKTEDLVDFNGQSYGHHLYQNSANYLTVRTNSANVKYDKYNANGKPADGAKIIEYKGSLGDFEFDPEASWILDKNKENVSANYQPMIIGNNDIIVMINKVALEFTVTDLTREYDGYYDEGTNRYLALPAVPNVITPDKLNPNLYVDNEPIYMYYNAIQDQQGNYYETTEIISGHAPTDVGIYYVIVGFKDGTNYSSVSLNTNNSGYVTITPKVVSIDWSELEVTFDATYKAPTASYLTALHEEKTASVYFYENDTEVTGVINAGEYVAYAKATTDSNHIVDETTSTAIYKINGISYTIKFEDSTISTEGYIKDFSEADIKGIIPGLKIKGVGGESTAKIRQIANADGVFLPGTYFSGDFKAYYSVLKGDVNVTKSVDIIIDCMVIIETREIQFTSQDVKVAYNEQGYNIYNSGALSITYPDKDLLNVIIHEDGGDDSYTTDKKYYDCGTYVLDFIISGAAGSGFAPKEGSVTITIEPAEPSFEFLSSLTRTYDGRPIDDTLIQIRGNFNKSNGVTGNSDLIYSYYKADEFGNIINSDSPICVKRSDDQSGDLPIDAGYYALVVTSGADDKPDTEATHNYKKLESKMVFQIRPKTLNVTLKYDKEVQDPTELNNQWIESSATNISSDGTTGGLTIKGLGLSLDKFNFSVYLDGDKMIRGKYEFKETFVYGDTTTNEASAVESDKIEYLFGYDLIKGNSDEYQGQTFILKYWLTNDARKPATIVDTTQNYTVELSFSLYIHYPSVQYELDIDDMDYTGSDHYAYVTIVSKSSGSTPVKAEVTYAESENILHDETAFGRKTADNKNNLNSPIQLSEIGLTDPGQKPIYLKIKVVEDGKYFEDVYDSVFIKVNPVNRTVTNNISTNFAKTYDGESVLQTYVVKENEETHKLELVLATDNEIANEEIVKYKLPREYYDYIIVYDGNQNDKDDFNPADLFIEFTDRNTNVKLEDVIDAGEYDYRFVIPASESGFFARTVLTGSFTITKKKLYLINTDAEGYVTKDYTGSSAKYSVSAENNHKIVDANGEEVQGFDISGTLITVDRNVGTYRGSVQGSVDWITNYSIKGYVGESYENVTNNYMLSIAGKNDNDDISEFKIKIVPGKMRLNLPQDLKVEYTYNGENHVVPYRTYVEFPTSGVKASYSIQDVDDENELNKTTGTFTSTQPEILDVKLDENYNVIPYNLWIKLETGDNTFEPEYIHLKVYVTRAEPTIIFLRPTEYEYSGRSVLAFNHETDITNTAGDTTANEYTVLWEQLVEGQWLNFEGAIPKEVGTYRMKVHYTPSQLTRYTDKEAIHEFTIGAKHIQFEWDQLAFVYNGKTQNPKLDLTKTGLPADEIAQIDVNYDIEPIGSTGDINSIKVGRYQIKASLAPKSDQSAFKASNYIIDGDESTTYNITSRRIIITTNIDVVYTGELIELMYDPSGTEAYKLDTVTAFDFAEGEYTDAILMTTSAEPQEDLYAYKSKGAELSNDFMWQNNSFEIYDENGSIVTKNYSVSYNISVRIVLNDIACDYIYDNNPNQNANITYDGQEHWLVVKPKNQGIYNVYYSLDNGTTWTTIPNNPIKVINHDFYEVKYKIYRLDEDNYEVLVAEGSKELNLLQFETEVVLKNIADLSKVYDGKDVPNPEIELAGLENIPVQIKYYYVNVDNNKTTDKVRAVGNYTLVIGEDPDNLNGNYKVNSLEVPFEITEREVIISYPETDYEYTGTYWKVDLDTSLSGTAYTVRLSKDRTQAGLAEGHVLTAQIRTKYTSARDLPYRSFDEFVIVTNKIEDENGLDVTHNYSLSYDLDVKIVKAHIELEHLDYDIETDYDGKPHSIELSVLKPAYGYTITYSTYDEEFTTSNPEFITRCSVVVNYRIEADNYEPLEGSATIKINGVKNPSPSNPEDEDENGVVDSHIQFDNPYVYDGQPYPTPLYVVDETNGAGYDASAQVVYYFKSDYNFTRDEDGYVVLQKSEINNASLKVAPTEVGRYKFVIYIPANGIYEDFNTNPQSFSITRRKIEVEWHDLTVEYNYESQAPYATFTTVQGEQVTLNILGGSPVTRAKSRSLNSSSGMKDVGSYEVTVGTEYAGFETYDITNPDEIFTITKRAIDDFVIMTDMEFEYNPEGKEIVKIRNKDDILVTIDEDGYVVKVGQDDWTIKDYIIEVSKDRNADRVGTGEHTISVKLVDPANTKWKSKGDSEDASDDLVTEFTITPYTFYGIQHSTDTKLWYSWEKFIVIDTKEENKSDFSLEIRTNGDNGFYTFIKPAAEDSEFNENGGFADYIFKYYRNARLSSEYGENAYVMITGINNFDFKLKLEYEITAAKPSMFELVTDSTAKFMYAEYLDGALNYYKNDFEDEDPNSEIIYIKEIKDEDGNVISTEEIKRENNAQDNIYLGHIYQNTSIFEVLSQIKNDINCMRVFSYEIEETTDDQGNVIYTGIYKLIDSNLIDDDDDLFDNYKTTYFGTGMRIVLYEDDTCKKEVDSIQGIIFGDLNGDGKVNNSDGQILQSYLMNEISSLSLGVYLYAGLVSEKNGQGLYVNNSDGQVLQSYLMNEDDSDYNSKYIVDTGV